MYTIKDSLNLKLVIALNRSLTNLNKKQGKYIYENGLTLPQFGVLELLYHKGAMSVGEIIEKTLSTSGNMTVVIENLRKDGYVKKEADPEDKRRYMVSLTKKGTDLIGGMFPQHIKNLGKIFEIYTKEEKKQLIALLRKLV